jgi:sacsin
VRIREILLNYPSGISIIKEIIQNSDDAGARIVKFCYDCRQHGKSTLAYPNLANFQGPALLCYNDGIFSEKDFISIQNIGNSVKKASRNKTGRFGLGFNAVYHFTDVPSFVSGKYLVYFDPHAQYLPNPNPNNPGKRIDFTRVNIAHYADQFAPFCAFGCDCQNEYKGTLFRFPLRSPEQARP